MRARATALAVLATAALGVGAAAAAAAAGHRHHRRRRAARRSPRWPRAADADVVRDRRRQGVRGRRRQRIEQGAERRRLSAQAAARASSSPARRTSCPAWPGTRARCTSPAARSRARARSGRCSAGAASTARRSPSARCIWTAPKGFAGSNGIAFAPEWAAVPRRRRRPDRQQRPRAGEDAVRVRHPVDEGERQRREGVRDRHPPAVADGVREGLERPVRLGSRPGQGRQEPAGLRAARPARATTTGSRSATGRRAAPAPATPSRSRRSRPTPTSWGWRSSARSCT